MKTAISFLCISLMVTKTVYAYIDMGSGSYIFQIAVAFLLGGIFSIKIFWNKIKSFFIRK